MPHEIFHTAEDFVRNISEVPGTEIVEESGLFRIVRIPAPFFQGSEWWVVNEKGFFWEPAESREAAREYLQTPEAQEYRGA